MLYAQHLGKLFKAREHVQTTLPMHDRKGNLE